MIAFLFLAAVSLDHSAWDGLLKRYVNEQHRVDYQRLKGADLPALDSYLAQVASRWPAGLTAAEEKAALINAYNALTVRWVVQNYPVASIWKTKQPFREARHTVNGEKVSLDGIETRLRKMGDPRVHAVLVCAARSCPPLRREAYTAEGLDAQLDANTREWLADGRLNSFDAANRRAEVSMIFKWYRDDFRSGGGSVERFLAKHGAGAQFLDAAGAKVNYKSYHWGLNDTSALGESYGALSMYWDALRNK